MTNTKNFEANYGWTAHAERLNGRVAMVGMVIAIVTQLVAGSMW